MHGAVFLDKNDLVIRPAILWNDQRTAEECEDIDRIVGAERVREITGNPPLTGFQLPKILWLRKHEPENFARVRKILLPKDYIRFLMTGVFATEVSDASGTGIFDVPNRRWSTEMMSALDLDPSFFPQCVESTEQTGSAMISGFHADGAGVRTRKEDPRSEIPVFGGGGDQAAGAVGTGAVTSDIISVSLGTSGVVFAPTEKPVIDASGALHTFCHANKKWHVMGVMLSCGGALSWYASEIRQRSVEEVLEEASTAEPGCGGLTFLPYLCGERSPHNDPHARATWSGLNLSHGTSAMSRSVVEGVTFGLLDSLERIKLISDRGSRIADLPKPNPHKSQATNHKPQLRVTGGGARSEFWVQMIADVFGMECQTLEGDEGPAFGAALIAGVGCGIWNNLEAACEATVKTRHTYMPSGTDYAESYRRYQALYPHLKAGDETLPTY
jgi:xylulokinase